MSTFLNSLPLNLYKSLKSRSFASSLFCSNDLKALGNFMSASIPKVTFVCDSRLLISFDNIFSVERLLRSISLFAYVVIFSPFSNVSTLNEPR